MNNRKIVSVLFLTFLFSFAQIYACTTIVISGKYTKDGRPMLWKNRDTESLNNKLMYFNDGKYTYTGLVNSEDKDSEHIWFGINSAGFAIMNSASYNLNLDDDTTIKDREGIVMKLALQNCATIDEFETLLKEMDKPIGVSSNFGVIDANGGAAFFETGNFEFTKLDANDPALAPLGYIIHSNYSYTGKFNVGYGFIRYSTAEDLFYKATGTNELTHKFILQNVTRSLKHSLLKTDLHNNHLTPEDEQNFVPFNDYISRYSSSSATVIKGVKKGEDPAFTTMWTILGFPHCAFSIPVWLTPNGKLPKILTAEFPANAPLCDYSLELKKRCYPITRGSGRNYLNLSALLNSDNTGILQKLVPFEDKIFEKAKWELEEWHKNGFDFHKVEQFYNWIDNVVFPEYKSLF